LCEDIPSEEEFFSTEELLNSDISYAEAEGNLINNSKLSKNKNEYTVTEDQLPLPLKEKPQVQNLEFEEQIKDLADKLDELKTVEEQPKYATHKSENKSELISFTNVETQKRHDKVIFNIPIKVEPLVEITEIHSDEETEIQKQGEISNRKLYYIQYTTNNIITKKPFDFCFSINKNLYYRNYTF
jgi:hypothetical protein